MIEHQHYSQDSIPIANQIGTHLDGVTQRIGKIDILNHAGLEHPHATLRACDDLQQRAARRKQPAHLIHTRLLPANR